MVVTSKRAQIDPKSAMLILVRMNIDIDGRDIGEMLQPKSAEFSIGCNNSNFMPLK